jgi:hypothetical protein
MKNPQHSSVRTTSLLVGSVALALVLSSCAAETAEISQSPSQMTPKITQATASQNTSATPEPTSSSFVLKSVAMDKSCEQIITVQSLYNFDQNLASYPSTQQAPGTIAQQQSQLGAVSCTISNLSTQEEVYVTVTKLDGPSRTYQQGLISSLGAGYSSYQIAKDAPGSFYSENGEGIAQFIAGPYWVSLASSTFKTGVDASLVSNLVWNNLK